MYKARAKQQGSGTRYLVSPEGTTDFNQNKSLWRGLNTISASPNHSIVHKKSTVCRAAKYVALGDEPVLKLGRISQVRPKDSGRDRR